MRVIENPYYSLHDPHWKFVLGPDTYATRDVPQRVDLIRAALQKDSRFRFQKAKRFPECHFSEFPYHQFIVRTAKSILDDKTETYPDLFPGEGAGRKRRVDNPLWGGVHCTDAVTPILRGTWQAARGSGEAALTGAQILISGKEREVYALCRPSGHHAGPRVFGGYCYYNNSVLAANLLRKQGKVAILDIDFHHGNGTQEYFYQSSEVFTASIHCDPEVEYPYFWGYESEKGEGKGKNANLNLPLTKNADKQQYLAAVSRFCRSIKRVQPDWLIISAGFDTHKNDPVGGFRLETEDFIEIGEELGQLGLPTLINQEGGYNPEVLGPCVLSFLSGFLSKRRD